MGRDEERLQRGITTFAAILNVPEADVKAQLSSIVGPEIVEDTLLAAGGRGWYHPGLTLRERSIVIITALICQGIVSDRLKVHLDLGKRNGLDDAGVDALIALLGLYAGLPLSSLAAETVVKVRRSASPERDQREFSVLQRSV